MYSFKNDHPADRRSAAVDLCALALLGELSEPIASGTDVHVSKSHFSNSAPVPPLFTETRSASAARPSDADHRAHAAPVMT